MDYIGKIVYTDEYILKVSIQKQDKLFGYNLNNENEIVEVSVSQVKPIPKSVYDLIGNERAQLQIAMRQEKSSASIAKKMNITPRTLFRKIMDYNLYTLRQLNKIKRSEKKFKAV